MAVYRNNAFYMWGALEYYVKRFNGLELTIDERNCTFIFTYRSEFVDQDGEENEVVSPHSVTSIPAVESDIMPFLEKIYTDLKFKNKQTIKNILEEGIWE